VLRIVLGPKREDVTVEWRKLFNEELRDFNSLPNIVRVVKSRPLGRPRRRWADNIKMDVREAGGGADRMELTQDRDRWRALVNTVMKFRVP